MIDKNFITPLAFLVGFGIILVSPEFLSSNKFLKEFVNHEYIGILSVIVTVSMVSVVQLHLEYTRVERRFRVRVFSEARSAINNSAKLLTSLLIFSFFISIAKASFEGWYLAVSLIYLTALCTVLEAVLTMYGLAQTACVLAENEPIDEDDTGD